MRANTHLGIDRRLCGEPVELAQDRAVVRFVATPDMGVDDRGLVHGGFVFGLLDHAAMLAVDDPLVVLGSAEVRFVAPVAVGQTVLAEAWVVERKGRKHRIEGRATVDGKDVLTGVLTAFVLDRHVLDG